MKKMRLHKEILVPNAKWKALISVIAFLCFLALLVAVCSAKYRRLTWLFYYSVASNCPVSWLVPVMPQEPMLLLYGSLYEPWLVALTAGVATFVIELLNYQILIPVSNLRQLEPFKEKRICKFLERWYNKIPFAIIAFVGFTPVPHLPFRLLAVLTKYSIVKYALASFVGRAAFYYIVAMTGGVLNLPYWVYIIFLLAMILLALIIKIVHFNGQSLHKREVLQ